jgi:hypothetical protein
LEHVVPPVNAAIANLRLLLAPGGFIVLTVPYTLGTSTIEHFPELNEYHFVEREGRRALVNTTWDGRVQTFDNLVFHGGEGNTLEMRLFAEAHLIAELEGAGFEVTTLRHSVPKYGIVSIRKHSLPMLLRLRE